MNMDMNNEQKICLTLLQPLQKGRVQTYMSYNRKWTINMHKADKIYIVFISKKNFITCITFNYNSNGYP